MTKKPTPDLRVISEIAALNSEPTDRFVGETFWHAHSMLRERFPDAAIALEMMAMTFGKFHEGLSHEDISAAYPPDSWREDTVEIPRAWLSSPAFATTSSASTKRVGS